MTEAIEYEQFDQAAQPNGAPASDADLSRLSDIPMELSVEIGRTHMTVGETLDLRVGSVVALERLSGETADLLVNGTAIARGEVVVIDEQYGLRITEIVDSHHDGDLAKPAGEVREGQQAPAEASAADGQGGGDPAGAGEDGDPLGAAEPQAGASQAAPAGEGGG